MSRKKETARIIKDVSYELLGTALDISLFLICFGTGWIVSGMASRKRADLRPLKEMLKKYPELRIKVRNALHMAKRDGYISEDYQELTESGKSRLNDILPKYKRSPVWSGSLWLITYDIAERHKKDRERLRNFLIDQGYGRLQDSIYVAPFNPTNQVRRYIKELNIEGETLISKMGKGGHIGNMNIKELIGKVYKLDLMRSNYQIFVSKIENNKISAGNAPFLFLEYLSILKQDPQLPPQLLPSDWGGDRAYKLVKSKLLPLLAKNKTSKETLSALQISSN